ncbi:MAG: hypothetical protein II180_09625 [Proteobacteria bacterium]|nr:hypothetical protein [Pseudomonadota bacterium]
MSFDADFDALDAPRYPADAGYALRRRLFHTAPQRIVRAMSSILKVCQMRRK